MLSRRTPRDHTGDQPVELRNGSVSIDGRPVVRGVDLSITSGEFVALMGANGSGKSTLVRALTGLRPLSGGALQLFGEPIDDFHQWQRIGYVPQRPSAGTGVPVSVWEVVASGRLTRRRPFVPLRQADKEAIRDAIAVVGLADRAQAAVGTLSGGQQQRTLIARALAGQPELLFLDEPTAGVDLPNQEELARTLEVLKQREATVVLVAHELGPLSPLVDRAVVLRDGRVVHDGAPLAWADVHRHDLGDHAHHPDPEPRDHLPHVLAPFETSPAPETETPA